MMIGDIALIEKPLVGTKIGSYNTKFNEKWGKPLLKALGEDAKLI